MFPIVQFYFICIQYTTAQKFKRRSEHAGDLKMHANQSDSQNIIYSARKSDGMN